MRLTASMIVNFCEVFSFTVIARKDDETIPFDENMLMESGTSLSIRAFFFPLVKP